MALLDSGLRYLRFSPHVESPFAVGTRHRFPLPEKNVSSKIKTPVLTRCEVSEKYSKGDAPGEYGGPPIDTRIRKSWGGDRNDPITSKENFIWNVDWKKRLDSEARQAEAAREEEIKLRSKEKDSGFLSIGRTMALDSLDVDLSEELGQPSKATLERQVAAARRAAAEETTRKADEGRIKWRFAPTKREEQRWEQGTKYNSGGTDLLLRQSQAKKRDPVAERELDEKRFQQLKQNLQIYTIGIGGASAATAYFVYSAQVGLSYSAGLLGALVYIRMLSNSVEAFGSSSAGSAVRGALGQPRLLVPVVLVMALNRWNTILVPDYGVIPLELIPMLVGFFTYKAATLVQSFQEILLPIVPNGSQSPEDP